MAAKRKQPKQRKPAKAKTPPRPRVRGRFASKEAAELAKSLLAKNAGEYADAAERKRLSRETRARNVLRNALGTRKRRKGEKAVSPEILEKKRREKRGRASESYKRKRNGYEIEVFHTRGYFDESKQRIIDWIESNTKASDVMDVSVYNRSYSFGTKANFRDYILQDLTGNDPRFNDPTQSRPGTVFWLKKETKANWSVTVIRKVKK